MCILRHTLQRTCILTLIVVEKKREIYFIDHIKFHIDTLTALGSFLEIEVIDATDGMDIIKMKEQCQFYMNLLDVQKETQKQNILFQAWWVGGPDKWPTQLNQRATETLWCLHASPPMHLRGPVSFYARDPCPSEGKAQRAPCTAPPRASGQGPANKRHWTSPGLADPMAFPGPASSPMRVAVAWSVVWPWSGRRYHVVLPSSFCLTCCHHSVVKT